MNRRDTVFALLVLGASPLASQAQQPPKVRRIGYLDARPRPTASNPDHYVEAFTQGMRDLGYVEGKNLIIEWRFADDRYERLPALAAELVRMDLEVIVTYGTPPALALKRATSSVPIVFAIVIDPVGSKLAASLARPGGNMTGLSNIVSELGPKQLEFLRTVIPSLVRVAILINPGNSAHALIQQNLQTAGQKMGVKVLSVNARTAAELDQAFALAARERGQAIIVAADAIFVSYGPKLAELAFKYRIPLMSPYRNMTVAGGLISFGPSFSDSFRHAATYVDKILKGAKPAELPIEQPTKFELVVNLKTSEALGITIPGDLLLRVDESIQ